MMKKNRNLLTSLELLISLQLSIIKLRKETARKKKVMSVQWFLVREVMLLKKLSVLF